MTDDIPPTPHPNCKCYIDVIAVNKDTTPINKPDTNKTNWIMPCNGKIVGIYGEQLSTHIHNITYQKSINNFENALSENFRICISKF